MNASRGVSRRWLTAMIVLVGLYVCPSRLPAAGSPYANTGRPPGGDEPPSLVVKPPQEDTPRATEEGPPAGGPPPQHSPEPGSLVLGVCGCGLAGLAAWARRRRTHALQRTEESH